LTTINLSELVVGSGHRPSHQKRTHAPLQILPGTASPIEALIDLDFGVFARGVRRLIWKIADEQPSA
jgi:hypothetical protein